MSMNQRIQELYKQAMVTVPENLGNQSFTWFDPEKFAKLILGECTMLCGAVHSASEHVRGAGDPFGLGAAKCKSMIKGHFGVKE
jgi:hypothetical protein